MKKERKKVKAKEVVIDFFISAALTAAGLIFLQVLDDDLIGILILVPAGFLSLIFVAKLVQFIIDSAGRVDESDKLRAALLDKIENGDAPNSTADEIAKFKSLLDSGAITQEEYEEKKRQLLNL